MDLVLIIAWTALAYFIGAIPFGFLLARSVAGVDIRTSGSGNIGATNVGRVLGWKWFPVVLALDFSKGFFPAFLAYYLLPHNESAGSWLHAANLAVLAGTAAFLGHLYPIYLGFRGGKGMAAGLGAAAALAVYGSWIPLATAIGLFAATVAISRYVSLGSIVAAVSYGVLQIMLVELVGTAAGAGIVAFSVIVPLFVVWRHRSNIVRLWRGTELAIGQKKASDAEPSSVDVKPAPADSARGSQAA